MERTDRGHGIGGGGNGSTPGELFQIDGKAVRGFTDLEIDMHIQKAADNLTQIQNTLNTALGQTIQFNGMLAVLNFEKERRVKSLLIAANLPA